MLAVQGGEQARAMAIYEEIEALARAENDTSLLSLALVRRSFTASMMGDAERGEAMAREGQALALQTGEPRRVASALNSLGRAAMMRGEYERALAIYEECLALSRQAGVAYLLMLDLDQSPRQRWTGRDETRSWLERGHLVEAEHHLARVQEAGQQVGHGADLRRERRVTGRAWMQRDVRAPGLQAIRCQHTLDGLGRDRPRRFHR